LAQKKRARIVTPSRSNPDPPSFHARFSEAAAPAHPPGDAAFIACAGNIRITRKFGE